jgi:hypothetical protein
MNNIDVQQITFPFHMQHKCHATSHMQHAARTIAPLLPQIMPRGSTCRTPRARPTMAQHGTCSHASMTHASMPHTTRTPRNGTCHMFTWHMWHMPLPRHMPDKRRRIHMRTSHMPHATCRMATATCSHGTHHMWHMPHPRHMPHGTCHNAARHMS